MMCSNKLLLSFHHPVYGPPVPRRLAEGHGSASDGQDAESRHAEPYERLDPRSAWIERGYPPHSGKWHSFLLHFTTKRL